MENESPRPHRCPICNHLICSHGDEPPKMPEFEIKTFERNINALKKAKRDEILKRLPDLSRFPL